MLKQFYFDVWTRSSMIIYVETVLFRCMNQVFNDYLCWYCFISVYEPGLQWLFMLKLFNFNVWTRSSMIIYDETVLFQCMNQVFNDYLCWNCFISLYEPGLQWLFMLKLLNFSVWTRSSMIIYVETVLFQCMNHVFNDYLCWNCLISVYEPCFQWLFMLKQFYFNVWTRSSMIQHVLWLNREQRFSKTWKYGNSGWRRNTWK